MRSNVLAAAAAALLFSASATAVPGNLAGGGQFSAAQATTGVLSPLVTGNPALLLRSLRAEQSVRFNFIDLPSLALEVGEVDDFDDRFEAVEDRVDEGFSSEAEAQEFVDTVAEPLFADLGRDGYLTADAYMPVPALPVVFRGLGGVWSLHADATLSTRASVLDEPFDVVVDPVTNAADVETDSAALLRTGIFQRIAVGYGRELAPLRIGGLGGSLQVGARLSVIRGELSQVVAALDSDDDANGDDAFDRLDDNFDDNQEATVDVAIDVGAAFVARYLHVGVTVRNLLPPTLDFGRLGGCDGLSGGALSDCRAEEAVADRIGLARRYRQDPQGVVEAMIQIPDTGLRFYGTVETNSVENVGGDDYQFLSLGTSFDTGRWWAPGLRFGLRRNLAGTGITALSTGFTLLRFVQLDVLYGLSTTDIDDTAIPRNLGVRLGFGMSL